VIEINELDNLLAIDYIKNGINELPVSPDDNVPAVLKTSRATVQSWNWAYGQTPEFTYTVHNTFSWGTVVSLPAWQQFF